MANARLPDSVVIPSISTIVAGTLPAFFDAMLMLGMVNGDIVILVKVVLQLAFCGR
ncbi:MAG: hypothetical protein ACREOZ_01605 [Gloeomargaritales cyanobacterium]